MWLQRFAWTEQKLAGRIKKRNSLPKDPTLLRDEPMFCFETAVKLLYWAGFVYEHDEVGLPALACMPSGFHEDVNMIATIGTSDLVDWQKLVNFLFFFWICWFLCLPVHSFVHASID